MGQTSLFEERICPSIVVIVVQLGKKWEMPHAPRQFLVDWKMYDYLTQVLNSQVQVW